MHRNPHASKNLQGFSMTSRARSGQLARAPRPLERDEIKLAFITPVYRRHGLTALVMAHRERMLERLPFRALSILIGDEAEHRRIAGERGMQWIDWPNAAPALGAKFNAGYNAAKLAGATHVMAIGSDSWLHWDSLADLSLWPKAVTTFAPLSAVRADGLERTDLRVRYAAGFGVGMIYPTKWLPEQPCDPTKARGCDGSTWNRSGHGKLAVKWHEVEPRAFVNFASPDVQVTDYRKLSAHRRTSTVVRDSVFDLSLGDDNDLVAAVEEFYAARAIGSFLTGSQFAYRELPYPGGLRRP
jgi:hypothetical protein